MELFRAGVCPLADKVFISIVLFQG